MYTYDAKWLKCLLLFGTLYVHTAYGSRYTANVRTYVYCVWVYIVISVCICPYTIYVYHFRCRFGPLNFLKNANIPAFLSHIVCCYLISRRTKKIPSIPIQSTWLPNGTKCILIVLLFSFRLDGRVKCGPGVGYCVYTCMRLLNIISKYVILLLKLYP